MQYNRVAAEEFVNSTQPRNMVNEIAKDSSVDENSTSVLYPCILSDDSTDTSDMWHNDIKLLEVWQKKIPSFVNLLRHTIFEDGEVNDAIIWVDKFYKRNPSIAILWIYSVYAENQQDSLVLDSLVRIVGFIEIPQALAITFVPLVKIALDTEDCQESAVMLCEIWRSTECLDALRNSKIQNEVLKKYATDVRLELERELQK